MNYIVFICPLSLANISVHKKNSARFVRRFFAICLCLLLIIILIVLLF